MPTDFTKWRWSSEHVQTEIVNGEYLSSESALILAGPPRLDQVNANAIVGFGESQPDIQSVAGTTTILFPVGLLTDFVVAQQRQIQSVFEIGSTRRYLIPEKITSSLRVSRVKFFGPSLLRVLYAYYPTSLLNGESGEFVTSVNALKDSLPNVTKGRPGYGNQNDADRKDLNKNRDWWINLQSVVFRQPLGLCMYLKASNDEPYGSAYLEECLIQRHTFSMSSDRVMMMEGVDIEFDRIAPIQLQGGLLNTTPLPPQGQGLLAV